jgi:Zn-dependent peptidase ImmA (M78 family)
MTPEHEARNLLEELGIDDLPIVPREICKQLGIVYVEEPLRSVDGMLVVNNAQGRSLISVNASIPEQGRKHFTGAHELGHLCIDALEQNEFYCTREDIETFRRQSEPMELRANKFAAELLMPAVIFTSLVNNQDPDWDYIKSIAADKSQTTILATAKRFVDLTDQACVLIVSKNRIVSWFHSSKTFKAYIDMDSRLVSPNTIAYLAHERQNTPNNYEVVKADNWVTGRGVSPHTEILEWTLPMNSYGQVLTILLDEDGIGGWEKIEYEDEREDDECSVEWEPPTFHERKRKR